ncbi:hypothetical protein BT69DRAFT_1317209, partial [Atractiella rhizophila]
MKLEDQVVLHPVSVTPSPPFVVSSTSPDLPQSVIQQLNQIHATIINLPPQLQNIPPPPQPVPNQRSQTIQKAREEGNTHFRNQRPQEAIKAYTLGLSVASSRALWESAQYPREEVNALLMNRSAAYMAVKDWKRAEIDVRKALEGRKGPGMGKAFARLGRVLLMRRKTEEAREALLLGLSWEPGNEELLKQLKDL